MTVSQPTIKYNLIGTVATSQSWSVGFWVIPVVTGTPASGNLDHLLGNTAGPMTTFWNSLKSSISANWSLTSFSAYWYPSGATTSALVSRQSVGPSAGTGGYSQAFQNSLVVTLLTGAAGRSRRGRMYLPFTGKPSSNAGQAATADVDTFTAAVQTLGTQIAGVSTDSVFGGQLLCVRSDKLGQANGVTSYRCDSKIDTQRRREDKIAASYTKALPYV